MTRGAPGNTPGGRGKGVTKNTLKAAGSEGSHSTTRFFLPLPSRVEENGLTGNTEQQHLTTYISGRTLPLNYIYFYR